MRLIQRSTRRFSVTEIGQEYYRHCVAMMVEADAAQEIIDRSRSEPQGIVRVSCPSSMHLLSGRRDDRPVHGDNPRGRGAPGKHQPPRRRDPEGFDLASACASRRSKKAI